MSRSETARRLRPSAGSIIGVVALVFALSGAALALPGKNSVTANDIKKNAVKTKAIKAGAVTEVKIADGAVGAAKLAAGAVGTGAIADGAVSTAKLADGAVSSAKIADGSVAAADLVPGVEGSRAWGSITSTGAVVAKNATITDEGAGEYCINPSAESGINVLQSVIVVGPYDQDNSQTASKISYVEYEDAGDTNCPNGFFVQAFDVDLAANTVTAEDEPFSFVIP